MGYDAPFAGLKVVDISQGVSGPYAGMLMAQYGAEVIKVEPLDGEWGRFISRDYDNHSAFSVSANLGKRSIALDLKTERGRKSRRVAALGIAERTLHRLSDCWVRRID